MRPGHRRQMLAHPAFADLLELHKADARSAWSKAADGSIDVSQPDFSEIERLWEEYQLQAHTKPLTLKTELGIDGHWLKREFSLADGKLIGSLLEQLTQAHEDGQIRNIKAAKKLIKQILAGH